MLSRYTPCTRYNRLASRLHISCKRSITVAVGLEREFVDRFCRRGLHQRNESRAAAEPDTQTIRDQPATTDSLSLLSVSPTSIARQSHVFDPACQSLPFPLPGCRGVARCKNVGWTTMASAQREPVTKSGGQGAKLKGFVIGTHRREAKVATSESLVGFHSLYCVLSHRISVILVTRLNVVGARCASVTTLLPLLMLSCQKIRWDGQWTVPSALLCHGVNWNRILTPPYPHPQLNSQDLHQSQERPLAKMGWTRPLQSTPWRRPCPVVNGNNQKVANKLS